jgi:hypothetical protein
LSAAAVIVWARVVAHVINTPTTAKNAILSLFTVSPSKISLHSIPKERQERLTTSKTETMCPVLFRPHPVYSRPSYNGAPAMPTSKAFTRESWYLTLRPSFSP